PASEVEAEVGRQACAEALRPFDLSVPPLLRARLLRLDEASHVALLTLHHIVGDAWSLAVLVREVAALYDAFAASRPSPLPELPLQYADYAVWPRGRLEGGELARELEYWGDGLAGAPSLLGLPTDRPRPPFPSHRGASLAFTVPAPVAAGLRRLG